MRKSTAVPFLALCFAGIVAAAETTPSVTTASGGDRVAQASATAAAPAKTDSVKAVLPAKTVKAKKVKAASTAAKDSTKVASAPKDSSKAIAPFDTVKMVIVPGKADSGKAANPVVAAPAKDTAKAKLADSAKATAVAGAAGAADTTHASKPDSAKATASMTPAAEAVVADSSGDADSTQAKKSKKRRRVVRETTVNTIDELKGKYRSPKKALFMSMVIPGLGQAYVGQNWFNYSRGAFYFLADVGLAVGWHHYVVTRQNAQIDKYQKFADANWSQKKYEDTIATYTQLLDTRNQHRESYCDAVQEHASASGNILYQACLDLKGSSYTSFQTVHNDQGLSTDSIGARRAQFPNTQTFYELIGKEEEFITGWNDADHLFSNDTAFYEGDNAGNPIKDAHGLLILATTPNQQAYINMRAKANDYARMQAYFLGGMVINHIVSAIDAALTAHYHNASLYQTETSWYDRLRLDSQLAWDGFAPTPTVTASFTF